MKIIRFFTFIVSRFLALLLTLVVTFAAVYLVQNRGLPSTAPSPYMLSPKLSGGYLDMHVHTAGLGYGGSGCFISNAMRTSLKFPIYLRALGVTEEKLKQHGDGLVVEQLSEMIRKSRYVSEAVLLALDGPLNEQGELDKERTEVYVPNEFVAEQVKRFNNLKFGASINPNRKDAIEKLYWAKQQKAVLVKWLPSIMNIDPADRKFEPFYLALKELNLPLLVHVGDERTFTYADNQLADPLRLKLPLSLGVTVIAAHIATTGENEGQENFLRLQPLFEEYPNLFTDISSLTQINKRQYLLRALQEGSFKSRMIYGSDWPLQFFPLISPWWFIDSLSLGDVLLIEREPNPFDKDVLIKYALGVEDEVFLRSRKILVPD